MKRKIHRKRKPKEGVVYLLASDENVYKFGCTTETAQIRCSSINRSKLGYGHFNVISSIASSDIYAHEKLIKCRLWGINIPINGEFFSGDGLPESTILKVFKNDPTYKMECF